MVTIPASLQPKTMIPGAITVAQERDIKRYGSLQAAAQARAQAAAAQLPPPKTTPAKPSVEQLANNLAVEWVSRKLQGKRVVRIYYGKDRTEGLAYARANEIYKELVRDPQIRRGLDNVAEIKSRAQELGFGENIEEFVKLQQRGLKELEQVQPPTVKEEVVEPTVVEGITAPARAEIIQPGRGVYIPIEDVGPGGIQGLGRSQSTIYTSPTRTGPTLRARDLAYLNLGEFDSPKKVADNFAKAIEGKGVTQTTIAIPVGRYQDSIVAQDFIIKIEDGKVKSIQGVDSAIIPEDIYIQHDQLRRRRTPGFTAGKVTPTRRGRLTREDTEPVDPQRRIETTVREPEILTEKDYALEGFRRSASTSIRPGQALYVPIEDIDSPTATIFTSPTRRGPTLTADQLTFVEPRIAPTREPVYIPLEEVGPVTPGAQPIRFERTDRPEFQPSVLFFGGRQIVTDLQPQFGTQIDTGFRGVSPTQRIATRVEEIEPVYDTTFKKRVTELLPGGAGVVLAQLNEAVYLASGEDAEKLKQLLLRKDPGAGAAVRKFLREQQAELKKALGRYTELAVKSQSEEGLTQEEFDESVVLRSIITQGQVGTLGDIVYKATEEAVRRGEEVTLIPGIGGPNISPRTARRGIIAGTAAYDVLTDVLAIQLAGGAAAGLLAATPAGASVVRGVSTIARPLRYTTIPLGGTIGGFYGVREFQRRGDIGDAFAAGIGGAAGFFGGVYSRQIVEGGTKLAKYTFKQVDKLTDLPKGGSQRFFTGVGAQQQTTQLTAQQIQQAAAYAKAKGISLQQAIRELFGVVMRDIAKAEKAARLLDLQETLRQSSVDDIIKFIKKQAKSIAQNPALPKAEKALRLRNLLRLVNGVRPDVFAIQFTVTQPSAAATIQKEVLASSLLKAKQAATQTGAAIATALRTQPRLRERTVSALAIGAAAATDTQTKTETETAAATDQVSDLLTGGRTRTETEVLTEVLTQPGVTQPVPTPAPLQGFGLPTPGAPRVPRGLRPLTPTQPPRIINLDFGREVRSADDLVVAYKGEVLTKKGYKKVTTKPYTKKGARDVVAKALDNATEATGKTTPLKKKVRRSKVKKGDGYYNKNKKKFRGFKIMGGKRIPLENTLIEKKEYRSDTPGEKRGLTAAQFQARQSKRAAGLPVRRTKRRTPFGF